MKTAPACGDCWMISGKRYTQKLTGSNFVDKHGERNKCTYMRRLGLCTGPVKETLIVTCSNIQRIDFPTPIEYSSHVVMVMVAEPYPRDSGSQKKLAKSNTSPLTALVARTLFSEALNSFIFIDMILYVRTVERTFRSNNN